MIKKLIIICLAAVLMLSTQFLTAQEATSPTSAATNARFSTDVDNFMNVNNWSGVQMDKWFSFLKMEDVRLPNQWQAGLALKLSNAYVGLYYNGIFNTGTQNEGTLTSIDGSFDGTGAGTTAALGANNLLADADSYGSIKRQNYFGVLFGIGNNGFKFTLEDKITSKDPGLVVTTADLTSSDDETVDAGSRGIYRERSGSITPKLWWGAAQPMQLGTFSTKPSAFVQFAVTYGNEKEWELTDPEGKVHRYEDFSQNTLAPKLGVDTGSIGFLEGDWGRLTAGLAEEIGVKIQGEGYNPQTREAIPLTWNNLLKPYVGFTYSPAPFFSLGARLDVKVYAGNDLDNGTDNDNYFGVGANTRERKSMGQFSTIRTGFQLNGAAFDKVVEKIGILDNMKFNFGINIFLPGYLYTESSYSYEPATDAEGYPYDKVEIKKTPSHTWINGYDNGDGRLYYDENNLNGAPAWILQSISVGMSYSFTPKVMLDWVYDGLANQHSILFSVKH